MHNFFFRHINIANKSYIKIAHANVITPEEVLREILNEVSVEENDDLKT